MKVPLGWLQEFVDVQVEAPRLGEDLSLVGLALEGLEGSGAEAVLDLDVTTNRVDCMNVYGVAREVSVLYGKPLKPLETTFVETGPPASDVLDVGIEAPELCPRFCARVLDVRLAPSPDWIRRRLEAVGVRPINNVVDLSNYVMIEMGQPSHAFDLARIPQGRLNVRWARDGERLVTLDGTERTLTGRVGVVSGPEAALALAGIMGGASSEVMDATSVVALEAAYWEPLAIRRGSKALGMHTEASHRFERGTDPEILPTGLARIAHLLGRIGGGTVRPGLIDRQPAPKIRRSVVLRQARVKGLLGVEVPETRASEILLGLGFGIEPAAEGAATVTVPSFRGDVAREADVIEEIARHHGLSRVPSTVPPAIRPGGLNRVQARERRVREILIGAGFTEAMTYSFVSEVTARGAGGARVGLANPLAESYDVLRNSLVVPGLLSALTSNLRQGRRDVLLFEIGAVFVPGGPLREERRLGLLASGAARPKHWSESDRLADFYDLKGVVEQVADRLGLGGLSWPVDALPPFFHPGHAAAVEGNGTRWGFVGGLHPDLAAEWELRHETVVGELNLDAMLGARPPALRFSPLPRFPGVARDISFFCDRSQSFDHLREVVRKAAGPSLRSVDVVDLYKGKPVPEGRVSLTLSLRYQDAERTLTGDEVQRSVGDVMKALEDDLKAEIRGE